jgi:glycosyltransferase involved in cell wall biosynthesis
VINLISVLCPVLNEQNNIERILSFFIKSEPQDKELLIIDGGSTDDTKEIVKEWCLRHSNIRLIDNPFHYVPNALNLGIKNSSGDPIIRIDGHADFARDYFLKIIETFNKTGADIVGGPTRTKSESSLQEAVAAAISNPFGIGGSKVHDSKFEGYTDHVTFGAWKRELFEQIGLFDERLIRNQDDEFHYRAKKANRKIYQNPEIKLWYHPRKSLRALFKQYFEYGLYKPLVLAKVKSEAKLRHFVPSFFVLYLISIPLAFLITGWLFPLLVYIFVMSVMVIGSDIKTAAKIYSFAVYPVLHIAYGSGFLIGLKKIFRK